MELFQQLNKFTFLSLILYCLCPSFEPCTGFLQPIDRALPLYSAPDNIIKIGEGTFGEAFKAGDYVCKVVPIDGDLRVNGEVQKVNTVTNSHVCTSSMERCFHRLSLFA